MKMEILNKLSKLVEKTAKTVWLNNISNDYILGRLYREASLQDCFYYHMRRELGDSTLDYFKMFIYPEYYYQGKYVDMAILVKQEELEVPIAIFEFKYLDSTNDKLFYADVSKVVDYIKNDTICKFFLGFIQEVEYDYPENFSWLNNNQKLLAAGRVIEMTGGFCKPNEDKSHWFIKST
ncbi:hypothetical protein [Paenibacillus sp. Soil522]|uniref:hypothetical protein n=1 Tax=Paenibacillus sp. Soil522 TaxID=1736388 RepID=UPI0007010466|nr:hypothetical protein [Paenibacillus sp. Soil522]KRE45829.1 hypothetical protein ASG81_12435 [Paenibacillus sp. Soil522]